MQKHSLQLLCLRFMTSVILLLFFSLAAPANPHIINGEVVRGISDPVAKSTVRIYGKIARASFTCTGVLIAQDIVLSAGHCLGPGWAKIEIFFADGRGPIALKEQLRPDNYTPRAPAGTSWNDIALLKLAQPAPPEFIPSPIAGPNELAAEQNLLLAGYGQIKTSPETTEGLGTLRKISQKLLNPNLNENEFLVSLVGGGACFGDSGGPAFIQTPSGLKLAGVASRLTENDIDPKNPKIYLCTKEMIYSSATKQMQWINQQFAHSSNRK